MFCLLGLFSLLPVAWSVASLAAVLGSQELVPDGEEGLREVGLDSPGLVVNVVVGSVVAGDELERVPRESVAAVVIDGLDSRESEEASALEQRHASHLEANAGAKGVEKETFEGVVVQSAVSIWDIETVVSGVESGYRDKLLAT
jgi:hypothetical protein